MKLTNAQQKMVDKLKAGKHIIGYARNWYLIQDGKHVFMGSKANDATIDALIFRKVLEEHGTDRNHIDYRVTVAKGK